MGRGPRNLYPGAYYHVYNRGVNKQKIVFDNEDKNLFIQLLCKSIREYDANLISFCLMDNHFHLFLQTKLPNLSNAMWFFSSRFAYLINEKYNRVGPLFQGRFKSRDVQEELYGKVLLRYIHNNPCDAHIVSAADQYKWSSFNCYSDKNLSWDFIDTRNGFLFFDKNPQRAKMDFMEFHAQHPSINLDARLRNMRCSL